MHPETQSKSPILKSRGTKLLNDNFDSLMKKRVKSSIIKKPKEL
jgi:hypothetical protein